MRHFLIALASFVLAAAASADTKLIYAGTLFAVPGQEPLKEQTVYVKDGKIEKVVAGFVRLAPGERLVDLRNQGSCDGVDECRKAVRRQVARGADVIKLVATAGVLSNIAAGVDQQFTDEELAVIVKTAHGLGKRVAAHAHGAGGINAALRAGVDSIEHGSYVSPESISLFRSKGAYLVPTIIAGVTVAEHAKKSDFLTPAQREKSLKVGPLMQAAFKRAYEGGVKIAFGTDMGVGVHGQNAKELALMVGAGMPPAEALKAATVNAADLLNLSSTIGTIEAGKAADIIAVPQDPLRDIKVMERVSFVMRGGGIYVSP